MTAPAAPPSADAFLMSGGAKSAKFETIGDTITGTITGEPEIRQQTDFTSGALLFWDDGRPKWQLVVRLQTDLSEDADDDGVRAVYVKGQMQQAVREACKKAGATGLAAGGLLAVKYVADGEKKRGLNPAKQYAAQYKPPSPQDDFFADTKPPAQTPTGFDAEPPF